MSITQPFKQLSDYSLSLLSKDGFTPGSLSPPSNAKIRRIFIATVRPDTAVGHITAAPPNTAVRHITAAPPNPTVSRRLNDPVHIPYRISVMTPLLLAG